MNVELWKEDVMTHRKTVATVLNDRKMLKKSMENYLHEYFNYDLIKFSTDLNEITLLWSYDNEPVINPTKLVDLGMDFVISSEYDDELGMSASIKIYPFGVEDD